MMQYIAKRITDTAKETIAFEKLNLTGMRAKGKGRHKRGLNRSLSTAAPGRLMALVVEKASIARKQVLKVNAAYTSQDCSLCGDRTKKGLHIRVFTCRICGTVHDRDVNAAQNIAKRGMA
jgi:putative transposase